MGDEGNDPGEHAVALEVAALPKRLRGAVDLADLKAQLVLLRSVHSVTGYFAVPMVDEADLASRAKDELAVTDRQETLVRDYGVAAAWPMLTTPEDLADLSPLCSIFRWKTVLALVTTG